MIGILAGAVCPCFLFIKKPPDCLGVGLYAENQIFTRRVDVYLKSFFCFDFE